MTEGSSYFTEEELRLLGQKYLADHPELEPAVKAERARQAAAAPEPVVETPPEPEGLISIVYPVSWPPASEDLPRPHSTLMFLGELKDATFTKDDLKAALKEFIWEPFDVAIGEVKMFGENEDTPVVTLLSQALYNNRQALEEELNKRGIEDKSEFDYSPHITVTQQAMTSMPFHSVRLGTPQIWWGNDRA